MQMREKKPKGHWLGVGIGLGIGFGMPLGVLIGVIMDNIPIGISIGSGMGVSVGTAIGSALEAKHRDETRPLLAEERKRKNVFVILGLVMLIAALAIFAFLWLKTRG